MSVCTCVRLTTFCGVALGWQVGPHGSCAQWDLLGWCRHTQCRSESVAQTHPWSCVCPAPNSLSPKKSVAERSAHWLPRVPQSPGPLNLRPGWRSGFLLAPRSPDVPAPVSLGPIECMSDPIKATPSWSSSHYDSGHTGLVTATRGTHGFVCVPGMGQGKCPSAPVTSSQWSAGPPFPRLPHYLLLNFSAGSHPASHNFRTQCYANHGYYFQWVSSFLAPQILDKIEQLITDLRTDLIISSQYYLSSYSMCGMAYG